MPCVPDLDVVRLDPDLPLPAYARAGDAGLDLVARVDATVPRAGGRMLVPTGVAVAIPAGYAGLVVPRSGLAVEHGITLVNTPGLIDSGYRDEVKVVLLNTDPHETFRVRRGDRIAQLVLVAVTEVRLVEVDGFDGEHRGGGFGSTGR
jgi:dUTP pyrophosphatase